MSETARTAVDNNEFTGLHLSDLPFCHPQDATEIIDMYDYDNAPRGSLFGVDLSKEMVKVSEEERQRRRNSH